MKLSKAQLGQYWVTAWCKHYKVLVFSQPLISVSITWYRTCWRQVWLQLYSHAYLFPKVLWCRSCQRLKYIRRQRSGGAAPADIQYSPALNMQGQIAGATPLSQLLIYMNNCLQFCLFLQVPLAGNCKLATLLRKEKYVQNTGSTTKFVYCYLRGKLHCIHCGVTSWQLCWE